MSDLISRKALCEFCLNTKDGTIDANDIMRFPSAEPDRKKGEWVDGDGRDTFIHCSVCYEEAYWDSDYGQQTFDYCPYCGAEMSRGE